MLLSPRTQRYLTFISFFFTGLSDAVEASTFGSLTLYRETKFIIGFDFAVTLSSTCIFLCSFRHRFSTIGRTEMANVKQTQKMIPFITCENSLCQYVCQLVLGVNVFDLDLGVLETCLIVGLLPFMIILITALLSSKFFDKASLRVGCTFEEIKSTLSKSSIFPWILFRVGDLDWSSCAFIPLIRVSVKNCDDQIP